jgi:hypothetical protein
MIHGESAEASVDEAQLSGKNIKGDEKCQTRHEA